MVFISIYYYLLRLFKPSHTQNSQMLKNVKLYITAAYAKNNICFFSDFLFYLNNDNMRDKNV